MRLEPEVIVYENFSLHPGAAPGLTHNEMYPCQVIGAIKLIATLVPVKYLVKLLPSNKRYAGKLDQRWYDLCTFNIEKASEHTKDAYLLMKYYEMFYEAEAGKLQQCLLPLSM
jgi:hypothetical protein